MEDVPITRSLSSSSGTSVLGLDSGWRLPAAALLSPPKPQRRASAPDKSLQRLPMFRDECVYISPRLAALNPLRLLRRTATDSSESPTIYESHCGDTPECTCLADMLSCPSESDDDAFADARGAAQEEDSDEDVGNADAVKRCSIHTRGSDDLDAPGGSCVAPGDEPSAILSRTSSDSAEGDGPSFAAAAAAAAASARAAVAGVGAHAGMIVCVVFWVNGGGGGAGGWRILDAGTIVVAR